MCTMNDSVSALTEEAVHSQWEAWFAEFAEEWRYSEVFEKYPALKTQSGELFEKYPHLKPTPPWQTFFRTQPSSSAIAAWKSPTTSDVSWLTSALEDESRLWFVGRLARDAQFVSEALFEPMVKTAVCLGDPSLNNWFIEPCVEYVGRERVAGLVVSFADSPDLAQVVGAIDALYWIDHAVSRKLEVEKKTVLLDALLAGTSDYLRFRILIQLPLEEEIYPESHKPLVKVARGIRDRELYLRPAFE
jgi:hypothetical protein